MSFPSVTSSEVVSRSGATNASQWWKDAVIYQVYPRSFADSNGDGYGDLRGITSRLDYLDKLGIDAIWISPFFASPQADNGYDIKDYQDVDPMFGTLEDFDNLVQQAHDRGIRIIIDMVLNHSSDQHPWFLESKSSTDNPKRDWYWWRAPREGFQAGEPGAEPNNWESFFSGSVWTLDEVTGEYYLGLFGSQQPDLNWENPEVRACLYEMMRWWLERGVDGFRMDVINLVSKPEGLPDGPLKPGSTFGEGFPLYSFGPRLHEYMREMRREVFQGRDDLVIIGETPGASPEQGLLVTDPSREELDMVFQFDHVELNHGTSKFRPVPVLPGAIAKSLGQWQEEVGEFGWNSLYLENHDQPRSVSRYGDDKKYWYQSATALATCYQLLKGTPYIYQGQELGTTSVGFTDLDDYRDIESLRYFNQHSELGESTSQIMAGLALNGRDNARTPMQWDDSKNAGFTQGEPWIRTNPRYVEINAKNQVGDPNSVFEYYRSLIKLRHESEVIRRGSFELIQTGNDNIFAYRRFVEKLPSILESDSGANGLQTLESAGESEVLVMVNLSSDEQVFELPDSLFELWAAGPTKLSNYAGDRPGDMKLRPWEAVVV